MNVTIDTTDLNRAIDEYVKASRKDIPAAINKQFGKALFESQKAATIASKEQIRALKNSDKLVPLALKNLSGNPDGRPMRVRVEEYIRKIVKAKVKAAGYTRSVLVAMSMKSQGKSPKDSSRAGKINVDGRMASQSHDNAYVIYTHNFKRGEGREQHTKEIEKALNAGFSSAIRDIGQYVERKLKGNARKVGL